MADWESLGIIGAVQVSNDQKYIGKRYIELFYKEAGKGFVFAVGEDKETVEFLRCVEEIREDSFYYRSAHYFFNIPDNILELFKKE